MAEHALSARFGCPEINSGVRACESRPQTRVESSCAEERADDRIVRLADQLRRGVLLCVGGLATTRSRVSCGARRRAAGFGRSAESTAAATGARCRCRWELRRGFGGDERQANRTVHLLGRVSPGRSWVELGRIWWWNAGRSDVPGAADVRRRLAHGGRKWQRPRWQIPQCAVASPGRGQVVSAPRSGQAGAEPRVDRRVLEGSESSDRRVPRRRPQHPQARSTPPGVQTPPTEGARPGASERPAPERGLVRLQPPIRTRSLADAASTCPLRRLDPPHARRGQLIG